MGFGDMILDQKKESPIYGNIRNSIMTGIVKNNWNQDYPGYVQVELLMGTAGKTSLSWVRVMQPYGGNGYGEYFLPEIDTEVVVGFLAGDASSPVVLGCLWNKTDKLPDGKANEKNSVKSIRTKGGHEIIFDETQDQEKIEIKTKGELDICLQDKDKLITISDASGDNVISLDAGQGVITIEAKKKVVLKAGGEEMLTLDGSGKKASLTAASVQAEAKQALKLKGQTTSVEGNIMELKAQGSLKAEASGAMQLKGAICKIN